MFTVKATYRSETRKFAFQGSSSFPTYDQLYHQLYRVFPISHNYYLSKLLFSPDSSEPNRILIGREVHSAEEYTACVTPFQGHTWRSALLRFSIFDETPHKVPSAVMTDRFQMRDVADSGANNRDIPSTRSGFSIPGPTSANSHSNQPPVSMFHIPPPPIIYSSSHFALPQAPMDVDKPTSSHSLFSDTLPHHAQQESLPKPSCCSVSQGKFEVLSALTTFKDDIDRIITKNFGTSPSSHSAFWPPPLSKIAPVGSARDLPAPPMPPWRAPPFCSLTPPPCLPPPILPTNAPFSPAQSSATNPAPFVVFPPYGSKPSDERAGPSVSAFSHMMGPQPDFNCYTTPVTPCIPDFSQSSATNTERNVYPSLVSTPILPRPRTPLDKSEMEVTPIQVQPFVSPPPLVHVGVSCNLCNNTVVGVRHKCLDCPNYDLCSACMNTGAAERHNPFHEFFGIEEPGRVVVHTVFSGDGERDAQPVVDVPRTHHAACDLCDSTIIGTRYKCLNCPDFDACVSCFSIADEQHPTHNFVKLTNPDDFLSRSKVVPARHYATCNGCSKGIIDIRYKCMHPECPDFDLCNTCEAHPIPVHPPNHPMLKMRSADTVIPTVYRVGQTTLIGGGDGIDGSQIERRGRSPSREAVRSRSHSMSRARSYRRGYLHHSSVESCSRRSRSTRSRSPTELHLVPISSAPVIIKRSRSRSRSPARPIILKRSFSQSRSRSPRFVRYVDSRSPSPPQITTYGRQSSSSPAGAHALPGRRAEISVRSRSRSCGPEGPQWRCHYPYRVRSPSYSRSPSPVGRYSCRSPARLPSPRPQHRSPLTPPSFGWGAAPPMATENEPIARYSYGSPTRSPSPRMAPFRWGTAPPTVTENEPILIHLDMPESETDDMDRNAKENVAPPVKTGTKSSTSATSLASSTSGSASTQFELPPLAPPMDLFREFWPKVAQELRHLMQESPSSQGATHADNVTQCQAPTNTVANPSVDVGSAIESPLTGEALLKRPKVSSVQPEMLQPNVPFLSRSILAALLNTSSPPTLPSPLATVVKDNDRQPSVAEVVAQAQQMPEVAAQPQQMPEVAAQPQQMPALSAIFLGDNNVPDNQVFPPGAEFVKSWRMLNDGANAWPETTVLELVVGESFSREPQAVKVGSVGPGAVTDLWTGELKAPESSGKYVSYWRLNDGKGNMFGHSVWIDITVAEQSRSQSSTNSSLASSSIIMPQSAPAKSTASSDIVMEGNVTMSASPVIASLPRTDDAASDNGSDGSSVSLISIPSSDDDDDPTIWEDSRSQAVLPPADRARAAMEYVVLYDDSSSDEA